MRADSPLFPSPAPRFLLCVLLALACHCCLHTSAAADPKPRSKSASTIAPDLRLAEALARDTRPSIVVISHFDRAGKVDGVGTGFVVSQDGLIATSLHVIGEARPISVQFSDGRKVEVTDIHAWDRKLDLAVLRVKESKLTPLRLGDSDNLKQGAAVVALGNPMGLENSVVQGVVSARRELEGNEMIQIAIPIEPGNSGGPLLDEKGRVQGILTLKHTLTANLGFAMPVNALKTLLDRPNPVPMARWLSINALSAAEWTPVFGSRWTRKGASIRVEGAGEGFGGRALCLSSKSVPADSYELSVSVRLEDESGAAGLAFGSDGKDRHYGFYPTGGQLRLTRFDGPSVYTWTILRQTNSAFYHPGEWNSLRVRVEDDKIRCFVNGSLVFEVAGEQPSPGKVGLAKFRDTVASFRGFQAGAALPVTNSVEGAGERAELEKSLPALPERPGEDLLARFQNSPETGRSILQARALALERQAAQLRGLASLVHQQSVQRQLAVELSQAEGKIDLFKSALLVARLDKPDLDVEAYQSQLDSMAVELKGRLAADADAESRLAALRKYLFEENGFHGSRTDYYNRANSYVNDVLDDREGLPITLSVLFLELARRIGLDSDGVALPGHFVVQVASKAGQPLLVDPFEGGRNLSRTEAAEIVLDFTGQSLSEEQLRPARKPEIIARMIRNLLGIARQSGAATDSLKYLDTLVAIDPASPTARFERAMFNVQAGDRARAAEDVKWLIDREPAGYDLERLAELYRSLN